MTQAVDDPAAVSGRALEQADTRRGAGLRRALSETSPLRLIWLTTLLYTASVILIFQIAGLDALHRATLLLYSVPTAFSGFFAVGGVLSLAVLPCLFLVPRARRRQQIARLPEACLVLFGVNLMFGAFGLMKLSMPEVLPFHADALLAQVDRALHFGVDPWRLSHALLGWLPMTTLARVYLDLWLMPAMFLPVIYTLFDPDRQRRTGFTVLWFMVWIVLGTALAAAFLSGGPVYHDRLVPEAGFRFADLAARLAAPDAAVLHQTQEMLWQNHVNHETLAGGGISALPSVHVGMAAVVALYLSEVLPCRRILGCRPDRVVPIAIIGFYQFASVHLGWHYAVDGYVSILLVGAAAWLLGRGPWAQPAATAQAADTA